MFLVIPAHDYDDFMHFQELNINLISTFTNQGKQSSQIIHEDFYFYFI